MAHQTGTTTQLEHRQSGHTFHLNVIFREIKGDQAEYFVAECVDLPGCISEGNTLEEAKANLADAIENCVDVLLEDCIRRIATDRPLPDLLGVSSQTVMRLTTNPELQFA